MTQSLKNETIAFPVAELVHANATGTRIVRLDGYYSSPTGHSGGIQETFAELGECGVTFCHTSSLKKPKTFSISAETVDTFCQAWQEFRAARKAMHEQEQREYFEHIQDLQARVSDLGGKLIANDELDSFDLEWPRIHPMHGLYTREDCLGKHSVEERLKVAEQRIREVQEGAVSPRDVRPLYELDPMAVTARALIGEDNGEYTLVFHPDSPFEHFWHKENGLTLAQIDYRLRYIDGLEADTHEVLSF